MTDIFLGSPDAQVRQYILDHYLVSEWDEYSEILANASDSDFQDPTSIGLPAVGAVLATLYKVDGTNPVGVSIRVLGYNASIPAYVKYKNDGNFIYASAIDPDTGILRGETHSDGTEAAGFVGSRLFVDNEGTASSKTIASATGSFTYGDLKTFSVPASIVDSDGAAWTFCGYNITFDFVDCLTKQVFSSGNETLYSASDLRAYANSTAIDLLNDAKFKSHIQPCVNRTFVYSSYVSRVTTDSYQCEHVVDKLWLLGGGNVNLNVNGSNYDTSRFSTVFTDNSARIKRLLANDGAAGDAVNWWLRNFNAGFSYYEYTVNTSGNYSNSNVIASHGFSPAFVIA